MGLLLVQQRFRISLNRSNRSRNLPIQRSEIPQAGTVSEIPFTPSLSGARHGARRAVALGIAGARDAAAPSPSVISAAFGPACSPSRAPPLASTCGRCLPVPPGATPRSPVALRGCLLVCGRWRAVGQPIIALPADWRAWSGSASSSSVSFLPSSNGTLPVLCAGRNQCSRCAACWVFVRMPAWRPPFSAAVLASWG